MKRIRVERYSTIVNDDVYCHKNVLKKKKIYKKITKKAVKKLAHKILDLFYESGAEDVVVYFNNKRLSKRVNPVTGLLDVVCVTSKTPYGTIHCPKKHILTIKAEKMIDIFNGWNGIFEGFIELTGKKMLGASRLSEDACSLYPVNMEYGKESHLD